MSPDTTGRFDIVIEDDGADTKLHFAMELVARLLAKDLPKEPEPSDEELQAYVTEIY